MNKALKLDSINYTYTITRTAKTKYEMSEEHKQERKDMIIQKLMGAALIVVGIAGTIITKDPEFIILGSILGILVILQKEQFVCL